MRMSHLPTSVNTRRNQPAFSVGRQCFAGEVFLKDVLHEKRISPPSKVWWLWAAISPFYTASCEACLASCVLRTGAAFASSVSASI